MLSMRTNASCFTATVDCAVAVMRCAKEVATVLDAGEIGGSEGVAINGIVMLDEVVEPQLFVVTKTSEASKMSVTG